MKKTGIDVGRNIYEALRGKSINEVRVLTADKGALETTKEAGVKKKQVKR